MGYVVGIDLGTTYSAAAVGDEDGRVDTFTLGTIAPQIPSVVLLRSDGEILTGEAADRRGSAEPARTARAFKRRLGDPVPIIVGGTPYGAEALMAHLLRTIVTQVVERQGCGPDAVVLTHPANYSEYKTGLLREAARLAGLDAERVVLLTEPQAAAVAYARKQPVEPGDVVAVYDFGGGTFDAAVVRQTAGGFELVGRPEGMERLGGVDFDQAVLAHVDASVDGLVSGADAADPLVLSAQARLRAECQQAKEALSTDTDATIPVSLPGVQTDVRLTRAEFEQMIRPRVAETVAALERAIASAGIDTAGVSRVLLVGGSSRIPLVAEMVRAATGRPIAIDAHPKFAIALGAAAYALARRAPAGTDPAAEAAAAGRLASAEGGIASAGSDTAAGAELAASTAAGAGLAAGTAAGAAGAGVLVAGAVALGQTGSAAASGAVAPGIGPAGVPLGGPGIGPAGVPAGGPGVGPSGVSVPGGATPGTGPTGAPVAHAASAPASHAPAPTGGATAPGGHNPVPNGHAPASGQAPASTGHAAPTGTPAPARPAQPAPAQPATAQPPTAEPATAQPATAQSPTGQPTTTQPPAPTTSEAGANGGAPPRGRKLPTRALVGGAVGAVAVVVGVGVVAATGGGGGADKQAAVATKATAGSTQTTVAAGTGASTQTSTAAGVSSGRGLPGLVTTVAGSGNNDGSGIPGPAETASFAGARAMTVARNGDTYVVDQNASRLVRVHNGQATVAYQDAEDRTFGGVAAAPDGTVAFLTGKGLHRLSADGTHTMVADLKSAGLRSAAWNPLAFDGAGNLYIGDGQTLQVIRFGADRSVSIVAGTGKQLAPGLPAFGDGGPAIAAPLTAISALVIDADGNLLVAEGIGGRIRRVSTSGTITTVAGGGTTPIAPGSFEYAPDGTKTLDLKLGDVEGLAVDRSGRVYFSDASSHALVRIDDGAMFLAAANQTQSLDGPGHPARDTRFRDVRSLAFQSDGSLDVLDHNQVRRIARAASS